MSEVQVASTGAQVRRARKARGWTTQELADNAGVAQGTVTRIENGRPTRPGNLKAVLDALDLEPAYMQQAQPDEAVTLALDLVQKWLMAMPAEERNHAVHDLTRWIVLTDH
jgi:transcriptional regulator with XRE-family HTH domain